MKEINEHSVVKSGLLQISALLVFSGELILIGTRFVKREFSLLVVRLALPLLIGSVLLYFLLLEYTHGRVFSVNKTAIQTVGLLISGFLVMLIPHAALVATTADLAWNDSDQTLWPPRRVVTIACRIYASTVGLVGGVGLAIMILFLVNHFLIEHLIRFNAVVSYIAVVGAIWVFIPFWFFIAPICLAYPQREVFPVAWKYSNGNFLLLMAFVLIVLLLAVVAQWTMWTLLYNIGMAPHLNGPVNLISASFYQENQLPIIIIGVPTYLITTIFITLVRVYTFERIIMF